MRGMAGWPGQKERRNEIRQYIYIIRRAPPRQAKTYANNFRKTNENKKKKKQKRGCALFESL